MYQTIKHMNKDSNKSIEKTYRKRKQWFNNRASTIFPLYINDKNDQVIVFQDYWKWKNNINEVILNIRLRDEGGINFSSKKIEVQKHNEISIKKEFNLVDARGMIECEIVSLSNIGYPFPALQYFFVSSTEQISSVHSSGRILNSNEPIIYTRFQETDFLCIYNEDFEPFFHIYAGTYVPKKGDIVNIKVKNKNNITILESEFSSGLISPFSSKIFKFSDVFSKEELSKVENKEFFVIVSFLLVGGFGRLVVGNYDKKNDVLFVTHSFPFISADNPDQVIKVNNADASSYIGVSCEYPLRLDVASYPTNSRVEAPLYEMIVDQNLSDAKVVSRDDIITGGLGGLIFKRSFQNKKFSILFIKDKAPSRLNIEFSYSLENSRHPTDIAMQFLSGHVPTKYSHWGHGVCKEGFETYIFLRSYSDTFDESCGAELEFQIFTNEMHNTKTYHIPANSMLCIKASELGFISLNCSYFSWFVKTKKGIVSDSQWLSFNSESGEVCGDHGF